MTAAVITKDFTFAYAHHLTGIPDDHQCARVHGHNAVVRVKLAGTIVPPGWVVDYGELKQFGAWIDSHFDHQDLNEQVQFNPTAENLAGHLLAILRTVLGRRSNLSEISVGVSETPKTWAWVSERW